MSLTSRLKGKAIAAWLGPTGDVARRAAGALRRRGTATTRLDLYFDVADAWSYLAAQIAQRLVDAYGVDLTVTAVTPPAADVASFPQLRTKLAVRDCQLLVDYYDLAFPGTKEADSGMVRDVGSVLIRQRPPREQLQCALELADAMWRIDRKALTLLLGKWGQDAHGSVAPILNAAYAELRAAGHYQGGMLRYGDAWYGVDRISHLEDAIARDLGVPAKHVIHERPLADRGALPLGGKGEPQLEMWFSFRSPYSYLALHQIEAVLAPSSLPLVLRPVLPMVQRGVQLPAVKRTYLMLDAKREAERLGLPFGEICDPLGAGIDHCLAIAAWAAARSPADALAFAKSATRGIWAEAADVASYVDLRAVVERAQLPWDDAKHAIGDLEAARKQAAVNATDMAVYGLWGVPSFRVGDVVAWGQDRLPMIADRLRRARDIAKT
jgi:2-hydroxychromene-2-carboxylate isomerase|nr:DsbA family protein [Kofleriaceae bacterium]